MNNLIKLAFLLIAILMLLANSVFVISEFERGVKLRFGKLVDADLLPGIHVKIPLAEDVRVFDGRILTVDAQPASFFTIEKKRLIVDSYAKWRIQDVDTYYTSTGGVESVAQNRLANRVNTGLRNQFGNRTLKEVVSGERELLMRNITAGLNETVLQELGIEVVDVRVKRIDLPPELSSQVYRRMTA
jgi:membrane protease subunit HflC